MYLQFMLTNHFPPLNPPVHAVLMFTQYLANSHLNVRSVKNYLSGAKLYVRNAAGDSSPFDSPLLVNLIKGIARLSLHIPTSAPTLSIGEVRRCADGLLRMGPDGVVARAAFLFGLATFLRQSNYVTGGATTRAHLLRRRDLTFMGTTLYVHVRSTKTIGDPRDAVVIPVAAAPGSPYCPVSACAAALHAAPGGPDSPVFLSTRSRRPLTSLALITMIRAALRQMGHPSWHTVTLHSLRHTGATLAASDGATIPEIMTHGTWRSSAVRAYLPRIVQSSVPSRISRLLAK